MRQPNITNPLCTAGTLAANLLDPEPYLYTSAITGDTRAYRGALYPTPSTTRYAYCLVLRALSFLREAC